MSGDSSLLFKVVAKIILFSILFLIFIPVSYAVTQTECENGNGTWHSFQKTQPQSDDPPEPYEPSQETQKGYCSCSNGWDWDDVLKKCVDRLKEKCEETEGIWKDGTCECPESSKGYDPRFGCTYERIIPLSKTENETPLNNAPIQNRQGDKFKFFVSDYLQYIMVFLGLSLLSVFILLRIRRWKKD